MCGITGIYHYNSSETTSRELLKKMTDCLCHRGPDDSGYFVDKTIGLGHRRLSIIDLSTGNQPMYSADKTIALVFNGEIYNYVELKKELETLNHKFVTNSDTEVIIHAYEQWGKDCQTKFNGMWAFALWDSSKEELLLSRDRIGEKPLFYCDINGTLLFASEIKSFFHYGIPKEINREFIGLYLHLGFIPTPNSFYKNIYKLRPGHFIIVRPKSVSEHKYWDMPEIDENNMRSDESGIYEDFSNLLFDSVKIRMRSDVPYGAFLSGGLDSGSIVALMSQISNFPVETFTIGFNEKDYDERKGARLVANKFKTNHNEFVVEPEHFEDALQRILFHYDEPFGDSSAIPTGYISKCARQKVKMVLTGDGGDEVLSGYPTYLWEMFSPKYTKVYPWVRKMMEATMGAASHLLTGHPRYMINRLEDFSKTLGMSFSERLKHKISHGGIEAVDTLLSENKSMIALEDFISMAFKECHYKDAFYKRMYYDFKVLLPDDMLTKVDRISMAYSLETRLPYLDHRLIELMVHVDKNIKIKHAVTKSVLRETVGKQLPLKILKKYKKGFGIPLGKWFTSDIMNEKYFRPLITNNSFGISNDKLSHILLDHQKGIVDHSSLLWMLILLNHKL
jgi:asparagine synthase (glutamine-hydrolysing)